MKNIFRFFIGLGVGIVSVAVLVALIVLLSPLALRFFLIGSGIYILIAVLIVIATAFGAVWYLSRKEEEHDKSINYSIKQGKEIK